MLWVILTLLVAFLYGNLLEWLLHKHVLHKLGMKKIMFQEHWHRHHKHCRRHDYGDPDYQKWTWQWDGRVSEIAGLALMALLHLPLVFFFPVFYTGLVIWTFFYYLVHWFSHAYPEQGKRFVPWHYDHHMGKNQNANWCVTIPLWDWILGTRVVYFPSGGSNGRNHHRHPKGD